MKFFFSIFGFLHRLVDICLKSVCTKFQVNPSKIDEDMAILAKVPVIRIKLAEPRKKLEKVSEEGRNLQRKRYKDALDILAEGPSFYRPGIDD